jgi:hypothetical protein
VMTSNKCLKWGWLIGVLLLIAACGSNGAGVEQSGDQPAKAPVEQAAGAGESELTASQCPDLDPHPIGVDIADTYDVAYEQVMEWFCAGQTFEDILLALQTTELADVEIDRIFYERGQGRSWDQIWDDLGITAP